MFGHASHISRKKIEVTKECFCLQKKKLKNDFGAKISSVIIINKMTGCR
jgi:hypothetical protein